MPSGRVQTILVHFPSFRLLNKEHFFAFFEADGDPEPNPIRKPPHGGNNKFFCYPQTGE